MGDRRQKTRLKRVFINDVDGYSSKHIAQFLSTSTVEEEEVSEADDPISPRSVPAFEVVGTVSPSRKDDQYPFLLEQYRSPTRDELLERLLECDVVVYNISESATKQLIEEATWAITALNDEMTNFRSRKFFILVSSVMTWTMTKPEDPEEPDVAFTEEDFRRRRPHPNFRNHNTLEKLVLKLGRGTKNKLIGYVVACGLQYGKGENLFHYFFKVSWLMQVPKVPLFGPGTNVIPMIHVNDLGGVIQNIVELRPKSKYVIAVDDSKNTLEEIVQMISDTLGSGKIDKDPEQDAIAMKAFKPEEMDYLNINLRLDALILKDSFSLQWTSEVGMVENMENIVEEYIDTRQLLPIRISLVGPPAVGKTTIANKLCSHYQIHHIKIKDVIEEKITQLKAIMNETDNEVVSEEEATAAENQLEQFSQCLEMNEGRLPDNLVFDLLKEKLNSKPCRNQGFVLNGFLKSYNQAKLIFSDEDTDSQEFLRQRPTCDKMITPEHIFALNATDDFLTMRVQALPQSVAEARHYTKEEFVPRLRNYRLLDTEEETLLDFFDELEIHPEHIEITTDDPDYTDVMKKIIELVGDPKNFGLSPEEQEQEDRKREEERKQKLAEDNAERKRRNEAALDEMGAQYEEWRRNLSEVQRQESELLEAHSLPLRNYLMKYVMPSLTEAMLQCSEIKPEDPVDFLAEHLLRNDQQQEQPNE